MIRIGKKIFKLAFSQLNGEQIEMWLLLDTNRKAYMGSTAAPSDLTLSNIERSKSK